ncbi:MAG: hypothetical protein M3Q89_06015 [Verrucomicrobiota bacterium]|nr:hypothetical protein [Verrucomicrobiota bacterium]
MSSEAESQQGTPTPRRDVNAVLADHDDRLLAIAGVAGVYVGVQEDGRTPCLRVMLVRDTPALRKAVPGLIEGYPVMLEVTGEIRPLTGERPKREGH